MGSQARVEPRPRPPAPRPPASGAGPGRYQHPALPAWVATAAEGDRAGETRPTVPATQSVATSTCRTRAAYGPIPRRRCPAHRRAAGPRRTGPGRGRGTARTPDGTLRTDGPREHAAMRNSPSCICMRRRTLTRLAAVTVARRAEARAALCRTRAEARAALRRTRAEARAALCLTGGRR